MFSMKLSPLDFNQRALELPFLIAVSVQEECKALFQVIQDKKSQYLVEPSKCIRRGRIAAKLPLHKAIIPFLYSISDLDAKIVITIVQRGSVSQRLPEKSKWMFVPIYSYFLEQKKISITESYSK